MIPVSPAFLTAAKSTPRRSFAKVSICWTDPLLDLSIVATSNDVNYVSHINQTADQTLDVASPKSSTPYKYAHADGNFKPNGTFHPAPFTDDECAKYQMGWWSGARCGADATFAIPPILAISFSPRPLLAIVVNGDNAYIIPIGYFPRQDYMKTLKQIAQVCLGQAYFDRHDVLQIIIPTFDTEVLVPYDITKDDYFTKTNLAKTEELANIITVSTKNSNKIRS